MRGRQVLAAVLVAAAGCGDGLRRVPVEGTLTAAGSPLAGATVQFLPEDGTAGEGGIGTTDSDGSFRLIGSREGAGGVVPGKYRVRVSRLMDRDGTILPADAKQADYPAAAESIPAPYSAPGSPLVVTVPDAGGPMAIEIPVKAKGGKK